MRFWRLSFAPPFTHADLDVALIGGEGAANAQLVAVEGALSAHCDSHGDVPTDGIDLHPGCFHFNGRSSNARQAGAPLLDYQPVCRRTVSCSEEDSPLVGLEVLRALAESLLVVRRLRVSPPLSAR